MNIIQEFKNVLRYVIIKKMDVEFVCHYYSCYYIVFIFATLLTVHNY